MGQTFHAHIRAMLVEAEAAAESIEMSRSVPRGIVRLSCPTMLLDFRVAVMVASFMADCPDCKCIWKRPTGAWT